MVPPLSGLDYSRWRPQMIYCRRCRTALIGLVIIPLVGPVNGHFCSQACLEKARQEYERGRWHG